VPDDPAVRVSGAGSRRRAVELGRTVAAGVMDAFAARTEPLSIDTLRVQVRAGASEGEIRRAVRLALGRGTRGSGE
jgi:hypothetical protein